MAELSSFYTSRPGIDQGRVDSDTFVVPEGDYLFLSGSDTPNKFSWFSEGDSYAINQTDTPPSNSLITRFTGKWRGPQTTMPVLSVDVGPPNYFVLADGQTLILSVDEGGNQTVTFTTGYFVSITQAKPIEVVGAINAQLIGATASVTGSGGIKIKSNSTGKGSRVEIIGGTATALILSELQWELSIIVDTDILNTRILWPGQEQDLSDMGASIVEYTAPFDLEFKLELVAVSTLP
jgi:hypothetical protein